MSFARNQFSFISSVIGENVISRLRHRVARESASGVVALWWSARLCARPEGLRSGVVIEHGVTPTAAVRESRAVLHHEVYVGKLIRYRCGREELIVLRRPMDFRHLGSVRDRLPVTGKTGLVGVDHHGIPENHGDHLFVSTDGNSLPPFVSSELRKCKSAWDLQCVFVLDSKSTPARTAKDTTGINIRFFNLLLLYSPLPGSSHKAQFGRHSLLQACRVPRRTCSNGR